MQLGMIGLGRMGGNMTTRLTEGGHEVKTYDPGVESTAATLEELRDQLDAPRAFWMMVPAGVSDPSGTQLICGAPRTRRMSSMPSIRCRVSSS